jgi:hypothetical protein
VVDAALPQLLAAGPAVSSKESPDELLARMST